MYYTNGSNLDKTTIQPDWSKVRLKANVTKCMKSIQKVSYLHPQKIQSQPEFLILFEVASLGLPHFSQWFAANTTMKATKDLLIILLIYILHSQCIFIIHHTLVINENNQQWLWHYCTNAELFFCLDDVLYFHCNDWNFVCGSLSYPQNHDSSPVITVSR